MSGHTIESVKELGKKLSNWGRWGEDDDVGTLNFVTPEVRVTAGQMIKTGKVFDLGMAYGKDGPFSAPGTPRFNPIHLMMVAPMDHRDDDVLVSDDVVVMALQGATHWDGLAHAGYDDHFYNNVPANTVTTRHGASRVAFPALIDRLISRGVLLDIPRLRGVERLESGYDITADELDAAVEKAGVEIRSGDILLVRTGWYQHFQAGDSPTYMGLEPGLGLSTLEWLHEREIAAVAMDNWGVEVMPSGVDGWHVPFHMVAVRDMGLTLGEMFDLEALSADCAEDGVYEFMFCGTGLKVSNSVGAPVTPMVIK